MNDDDFSPSFVLKMPQMLLGNIVINFLTETLPTQAIYDLSMFCKILQIKFHFNRYL